MAHIQRLGALGIGVEATAGTAVTPTHWIELTDAPDIMDMNEYENIESARGRVELSQGQKLMKKFAEGSMQMHLDTTTAVYPLGLILGSVASVSAGGGLYTHACTINNTNTPKTATVVLDRVTDVRVFANTVVEEVEIEVSDTFVTITSSIKAKHGVSGTATDTYTTIKRFAYNDVCAKFGADVAAAEIATPTPLTGATITLTRGVTMTHASQAQCGTNSAEPEDFSHTTLEIEGEYSLLFRNVTDRDKYINDTQNAMILTCTNGTHSIKITLPNVRINNWEASNDIDDVVSQTAEFRAHYDATENTSVIAVVTNDTASYTNLSA